MKKSKSILFGIVSIGLIIMLVMVSGCSAEKKLIGKWYIDDSNYIELCKDGICIFGGDDIDEAGIDNDTGTWTLIDENRVVITFDNSGIVFDIKDNQLVNEDNEIIFTKDTK